MTSDLLCGACSFSRKHRSVYTARIENGADLVASASSQTLVYNVGLDVSIDREIGADCVHVQSFVAVCTCASWHNVVFRTRPPYADEVIHREVDVRCFLNCDLVHNTPAPHQNIVRTLAADLQPLGFLFLTWVVNRDLGQFKAHLSRQVLQGADRFLTVCRVVVDQSDRLTFEAAAFEVSDVVDRDGCTIPVVSRVVEYPREGRAVHCRRTAIAHGVERNTVCRNFGDQLVGNTS